MLVLSRQRDESLVITVPVPGGTVQVEIVVVDIRGDKVRLGAVAPNDVRVDRKEIAEARARGEKPPEKHPPALGTTATNPEDQRPGRRFGQAI